MYKITLSGENNSAKWYHALGKQNYLSGNHQRALENFDLSIAADPDYADSWLGKGVILYAMGRIEEAMECYDRAIKGKHDPTNSDIRYKVNEGILEIHPHNQIVDYALHNKGLCYVRIGQLVKALEYFDKAVSINPDYLDGWLSKAQTLASLGKIEEAITSYDEAIKLNPDSFHVWYSKGTRLTMASRWEQALPCYDEALKIASLRKDTKSKDDLAGEAGALDNKGYCLSELDRYEEALKCHAKALEINPNHQNALINYGRALYGLGRYNDAIKSYNKATQINPWNGLVWFHTAYALDKIGKKREAIISFEKALKLSPPLDITIKILSQEAEIFRDDQKFKEALQCYNKILVLDPTNEQALRGKRELENLC